MKMIFVRYLAEQKISRHMKWPEKTISHKFGFKQYYCLEGKKSVDGMEAM